MKSNKEWVQLWDDTNIDLADLIDLVKADALRHAAELCRAIDWDNSDLPIKCAKAIEAHADKLTQK